MRYCTMQANNRGGHAVVRADGVSRRVLCPRKKGRGTGARKEKNIGRQAAGRQECMRAKGTGLSRQEISFYLVDLHVEKSSATSACMPAFLWVWVCVCSCLLQFSRRTQCSVDHR